MAVDPKHERSIFLAAVEKGAEERAAFLDSACGNDVELRRRVEDLLRAHDEPGSLPGITDRQDPPVGEGRPASAPTGDAPQPIDLSFLTPSTKPGSLGRIDHYEIQEVVGTGGMGVVLKAFDETLHRVVALKALAPAISVGGTARKRFVREARSAAAVRDDHVVGIHAVTEEGPVSYLVMEFVDGVSLDEKIRQRGPLELKEVLRIGMQIATDLAAAHAQGLVHRDIKPENILLENGVERVKITDFGLARAVDDASLTQSGLVAGTPMYMSPEQAQGQPVDHRSDLFSLGSVLYTMCTGLPPFRAPNTVAILKRVCEDAPRPIREINPEMPEWLSAIVSKLHAKSPGERYQAAREVAELLGQHLAGILHPDITQDLHKTAPRLVSRHWWAYLSAAAVLVGATGLIYWILTSKNVEPIVTSESGKSPHETTRKPEPTTKEPPFRDAFEGPTLDPFWTKREESGFVTFPSSVKVHGGKQSLQLNSKKTGADRIISVSHVFKTPVYGTFSVWVYDTGAGVKSSLGMGMFLSGPKDENFHGIYVPDYDRGPGQDGSTYIGQIDNNAVRTPVSRTQDWHRFSFDTRPNATTLKINGTTVGTRASGFAVNRVFLQIAGPAGRPDAVYYFDDFEFIPFRE